MAEPRDERGRTPDDVKAHIRRLREDISVTADRLENRIQENFDLERRFHENPWPFVGACAVAGFVLGSLGRDNDGYDGHIYGGEGDWDANRYASLSTDASWNAGSDRSIVPPLQVGEAFIPTRTPPSGYGHSMHRGSSRRSGVASMGQQLLHKLWDEYSPMLEAQLRTVLTSWISTLGERAAAHSAMVGQGSTSGGYGSHMGGSTSGSYGSHTTGSTMGSTVTGPSAGGSTGSYTGPESDLNPTDPRTRMH